jgi:hypothetical protein
MAFESRRMNLVVHYVCALCSHHPQTLDAQKLHTILWLADGQTYASLGKAIVGEDYTRAPFGPMAVHLDAALRDLEQQGHLSIRAYGERQEYLARGVPDVSLLSADERRVLDQIIRQVTEGGELRVADSVKPGSWVSGTYEKSLDRSFEQAWEVAEPGESIPYQQHALKLLPLTPEDESWVRSELKGLK